MFKLKNSLITFAGLVVLVGVLTTLLHGDGQGQQNRGVNFPVFELRRYYLTATLHKGNEALTACAAGFHMASLWEIHDPSNLRYDTALGFKLSDSGFGPPTGNPGWIRTGSDAGETEIQGSANCNAWTSDSPFGVGARVFLPRTWSRTDGPVITPWLSSDEACFEPMRVWCVQN
jgi:hypothetical protein